MTAVVEENPLARSHELLWHGLPTPRKGPKPTLTLERIITAGIEIADAEGLDALSMRRLAKELGVGTMSLYRYLPSRDDLLNLMLDHLTTPYDLGRVEDLSWRPMLEEIAWQGRRRLLRHNWLVRLNWARPMVGPGSMSLLEQLMTGLRDLPFSDREKIATIEMIDAYVSGMVQRELYYDTEARESGISDDEFWGFQLPALERVLSSGRYPSLANLRQDAFDGSWDDDFVFGLTRMLDGIDLEVRRRLDSAPDGQDEHGTGRTR